MYDDPLEVIRRSIYTCHHEPWTSVNIEAKADGNWIMFKEKNTNKYLNSPRLKNLKSTPSYTPIKRIVNTDPPLFDPLDYEKFDNYYSLPPRNALQGRRKCHKVAINNIPVSPDRSKKYFKGNAPIIRPPRLSMTILNQMRNDEIKVCIQERDINARKICSSRSPIRPHALGSLYKRSITKDPLAFEFSKEEEKMAKIVAKNKARIEDINEIVKKAKHE